jgi:hypothetical protein
VLRIGISSKIFERMVSILVITKGQIIQMSGIKIGDHRRSDYQKECIKVGDDKSKNFQKNGVKISDHLRSNC